MNQGVSFIFSYILPVLAALGVAVGIDQTSSNNMKLCHHQYALCTSALCVPQPDDPTKAICFCDVEEGPNMATVSCDKLKPTTEPNGVQTIYSTFSLEQFKKGKKVMQCPAGTPWSACLNKRCTVDPSNPKRAICLCDIIKKDEWITLGGDCDASTCKTGYWSGATLAQFKTGNAFMTKALGLNESPAKWCPIDSQ